MHSVRAVWTVGAVTVCTSLALAAATLAATPKPRPKLVSHFPGAPVKTGPMDHAAIERELTDFSEEGRSRRLGPDYESYHGGLGAKPETFPQLYMPPVKEEVRGRRYEIGGPWTAEAGDFSSTQGQVLYVPEKGGMLGVDRVTILEMSNNCYSERPEPPWHGGFRPEPHSTAWTQAAGSSLGAPVSIARGMGVWANCGVIVFSSGLVGCAGTCTANGTGPTLQLPREKTPTAVSVTPKNEFALVTVFDSKLRKGQVAVIALAGGGTGFAHEWKDPQPGLCSVALLTGMKLLGFVDLPGIEFPTAVCAVGDTTQNRVNGPDGHAGALSRFDLAQQSDRDGFHHGHNASYVTRAGFAVVAGKYEQKIAFLDLQPLFQRMREMYLTTEENYRRTRDQGPGPKQWPYTFEADPSCKPPVVTTVTHPTPTAVLASMSGGSQARAFVASLDGKVGLYTVGGLATDGEASPHEVARVGDVQVGRNPVCLTYQKYTRDTIVAVSRGDREIAWIQYSESGGEVVRRLRDARLADPVFAEMADTHGTDTAIITVADFRGRQIVNYRFGDIVYATNGGARFGMGADGKAEFECGGVMAFPGAPFCISATNVN